MILRRVCPFSLTFTSDFFEEIAKLRAARRIWAREIARRYCPQNPRSTLLRTHTQTAGVVALRSAALQQRCPRRVAGTGRRTGAEPSLCTRMPWTRRWLCRRKRPHGSLFAHSRSSLTSRGLANRSTRLVGLITWRPLTDDLEQAAYAYFRELDELQGMVRAIEHGYPQREISRSAYEYQQKVENGEELLVGINAHVDSEDVPLEILQISPQSEKAQIERLQTVSPTAGSGCREEGPERPAGCCVW